MNPPPSAEGEVDRAFADLLRAGPGPAVAQQTPSLLENIAYPQAMNEAACS